tara:strand:- start:437 stop:751 length:315 start_codon:yes stop_codon:yes gene_type:complete
MAHYAKINNDGVVGEVIVADPDYISTLDESFRWIQTSYNNNFRKRFAGVGYTYDRVRDVFLSPKRYSSWILNETTYEWEAPTPMPDDDKMYRWDEDTTSWKEIE